MTWPEMAHTTVELRRCARGTRAASFERGGVHAGQSIQSPELQAGSFNAARPPKSARCKIGSDGSMKRLKNASLKDLTSVGQRARSYSR
jgi:hypothetical protein